MSADKELTTWKEIASYFGVTVRTVQKWEAERGLPVQRMPGPRGRVYAKTLALEAWLRSQDGSRLPEEAEPPRGRAKAWALAAGAVAVTAGVALWVFLRPAPLAGWRIEGSVVTGLDARGRAVWHYSLGAGMSIPGPERQTGGVSFGPLLADLDGDGEQEFVTAVEGGEFRMPVRLLCLSSQGELRWDYALKASARAGGITYEGPWLLRTVLAVPRRGGKGHHLFTAWSHAVQYPAVAQMLDAQGRVLREYWHSGHLTAAVAADLGDGRGTLIYAAAIANGYRQAGLVALDPERFAGASREENAAYQILDRPEPAEEARVLFARTWLNRKYHSYNFTEELIREGNSLLASVTEVEGAPGFQEASLYYRLGPGLKVEEIEPGDGIVFHYKRLEGEPDYPPGGFEAEKARLRNLRFVTPWRSRGGK